MGNQRNTAIIAFAMELRKKMRKLLLVSAPSQLLEGNDFNYMPASILHATSLSLNQIDQGVIEADYVPKIFYPPKYVENATEKKLEEIIERESVDTLLISCTCESYMPALRIAEVAKRVNPEAVTILGGPHFDDVFHGSVIVRYPHLSPFPSQRRVIDIVISGDAEFALNRVLYLHSQANSLPELKKKLKEDTIFRELDGKFQIIYLMGEDVVHLRSPSRKLDLDKLPFIRRDLVVNMSDIPYFFNTEDGTPLPSTSLMTHRGCRARCTYCSEAVGYNSRSIGHVMGEVSQLVEKGYKALFFDCGTFHDYSHLDELISELTRLRLRYGSLTRFDKLLDRSHVERLADCGFVHFLCGLEQYDDSVLQSINKRMTTGTIDKAIGNLRGTGIKIGLTLLFGLPSETRESIARTMEYCGRIVETGVVDSITFDLVSIHPGTPLFYSLSPDEARKIDFNRTPPNNGFPWDAFEEGTWFHPKHVTREHLLYILNQAKKYIPSNFIYRVYNKA